MVEAVSPLRAASQDLNWEIETLAVAAAEARIAGKVAFAEFFEACIKRRAEIAALERGADEQQADGV